ncbi:hypothetical protein COLO4_30902 [Corchorus olitorius]|uniref:F-box protein n=1 Tax=Corchorus olitorius TaxID=93759 RepID=A0A1R3H6F9_9ROSI|nr:hypothetical protein COLO4_30902 [Corchorus olitorius]
MENPTPWEALLLVSHYLDPKSLAIAACVSKSWSLAMSQDHVWQPLCSSYYPSLSNLKIPNPSVPYHRLFALGFTASKRRFKTPSKPRLSLDSLIFAIELSTCGAPAVIITEPAVNIQGNDQVFKFDVDVNRDFFPGIFEGSQQEINIRWNVVLKGWEAAFSMMDCKCKLSSCTTAAVAGWFSEELPSPGCCSGGDMGSGIVADVKVGYCRKRWESKKGLKVEKVSVGMLRCVDWRYVSVDDGLRYLQHFLLLPCSN